MTFEDNYSCCDNSTFPTTSFSPLTEYKLDAEGTFSMDRTKPYMRHLHIVEGLVGERDKVVHVSDIMSAQWMLGMWRNTRTRTEFINGICANRKMENYVTNNSGVVLHFLPQVMITRGVGKIWNEDSMYLTSKVLEALSKLNPTNRKSS